MSIKVVLAFLNSSVFQYIFKKKFSTHKVLRGDLEKLPFPIISTDTQQRIEHLVTATIAHREITEELEHIVFRSFCLSAEEIVIIQQATGE
jgi:hypothetical protein